MIRARGSSRDGARRVTEPCHVVRARILAQSLFHCDRITRHLLTGPGCATFYGIGYPGIVNWSSFRINDVHSNGCTRSAARSTGTGAAPAGCGRGAALIQAGAVVRPPQLATECWAIGAGVIAPAAGPFGNVEWVIPTVVEAAIPFDFCISDLHGIVQ